VDVMTIGWSALLVSGLIIFGMRYSRSRINDAAN
jgi:hypothetical protein